MLFAYFDHNKSNAYTLLAVMADLLRQILLRGPRSQESLNYLEQKRQRGSSLNLSLVLDVFTAELRMYRSVFMVVDAMDEATLDVRRRLLDGLLPLVETLPFNILVTSRDTLDMREALQHFPRVEIKAHDDDMRIHIRHFIAETPRLSSVFTTPRIIEEVADKIIGKTNKM